MQQINTKQEMEGCPHAWLSCTKNVAVNHLLDRISTNQDCDIERAILGASLGG